ncbi:PQQ-dependent sugar dehydrogenase [Actinomadura craniellae]|uniref:PQQ-dependent sugar dehydrogenase n=1 Tax=Actinomadura craniellae TaxID=2231787 RepID=A0A365GZU9_9ACTN|nr:PQQ-dependent sugar dehydrogenase [Actinomadura craniellae]RAY12369.1 PQQ-dependent sugar dehydrogenase [Actinomadura craniellae]
MRRRSLLTATAAVLLLAGCSDSPPTGGPTTPPPLPSTSSPGQRLPQVRVLATGLAVPWAVAFLPDGDALVTERDSARLLRVTQGGRVTPVGRVPGVEPGGEGGLMGVAISPSYPQDRYVYLYFTAASDNRVVRFRHTDGGLENATPIVTGIPKGGNHNGGRLAFGPDKMLYIATGEVGDVRLAQDRDSLGGKILRVTAEGRPAPGNPFGTRIWSYGHRNVQGLAWDERGRLYATEFGQDRLDEINQITKGANYGWPEVEGSGGDDRFTDPLLTWTTDEASPSGLAYTSGSLWAAGLRGRRLWQVPVGADGRVGRSVARLEDQYGRLRAVVPAPDGSLWVTTSNKDGRGDPTADDDRILVIPPH